MKYYSNKSRTIQEGGGLLNSIINKLPFEVHLPGYNFCGPGTKLQERLARGDKGINLLDEACKEHDIAYSTHSALPDRHQADKILLKNALSRINASDASWKEKLAAIGVSAAMNSKLKLGMGYSSRRRGRDTSQNKKKDKCKCNQYIRKSTTKKNMSAPVTAAAKQTTVVIKQSMKAMQQYLTKMETLLGKINGNLPSLSSSQKRQKKKLSATTLTKKRKIKKPQTDGEEEDHIDNYHEREIKKKIANRLSTTAAAGVPSKRKRKLENKQNLEAEVLEKRLKRDIDSIEEPNRQIVKQLNNGQKRKRSSDSENSDLGGYEINKKLKL